MIINHTWYAKILKAIKTSVIKLFKYADPLTLCRLRSYTISHVAIHSMRDLITSRQLF